MLRWKPRLGVCGGGGEAARTGQRAVTHGGADGGSGGAHLPVPVSHHTLLAFEGTVVGILHIFRVADLRQGWGTGGGRLQKPQSPSEHPPRQRPGQRQTLCTGVSPSVSACLGRSWKLKLGRGCPAGQQAAKAAEERTWEGSTKAPDRGRVPKRQSHLREPPGDGLGWKRWKCF